MKELVGDTPVMSLGEANRITNFIEEHNIKDILELGFAHGVSTCYLAAALSRIQGGTIVTIDRETARQREPNIETLLARVGECDRVKFLYEATSYTWRLMKFLEESHFPTFDMCYIDGAHTWFVDGFAFYLVNLLLKPGGWIIFDDLNWTFANSPSLKNTEGVIRMPQDEKTTPQVRKVYELLVKPHPDYHNFLVDGKWAFAQKKDNKFTISHEREIIVEKIIQKEYFGLGQFFKQAVKKIFKP